MNCRIAIRVVCLAWLSGCLCTSADDQIAAGQSTLEDLGDELLLAEPGKPIAPIDKSLEEILGEEKFLGEDVRAEPNKPSAADDDWLSNVVGHMQSAQKLLAQVETLEHVEGARSASSAQADALAGIDAMILELTKRKRQCQGGKCETPGPTKPGSKSGSGNKAGNSPAKAGSPETNSGKDLSTDLAVAGDLVKDLWGHLPERQRDRILQPLREEFLPKYASEIEAYFRALATPDREQPESP